MPASGVLAAGLALFAPLTASAAGAAASVRTVTTLTSTMNPVKGGTTVTFTCFVTVPRGIPSGEGAPSGSVRFTAGATTLGTAVLGPTGTATLPTRSLRKGTDVVTASYLGDATYRGSSASMSESVSSSVPAPTRTLLSFTPNRVETGGRETLTAAVTALGAGSPGGSVVFTRGTATLGRAALNGKGRATLHVTDLPAGNDLIRAAYGGTRSAAPSATSGTVDVVTIPVPSSVSLASQENPAFAGEAVTFTARVTSGGQAPSGSVTFESNGASLGTVALSGGAASLSTSALSPGDHVITAAYAGSRGHGGAESDLVETVTSTKAPTDVLVTSSFAPSYAGDAVTYSALVTPADGVGTPSGSVAFSARSVSGTTPLGTAILRAGVARLSSSALPAGTYEVSARYGGDAADLGGSGQLLQQVSSALLPSSINLSASSDPSSAGNSVTFTAAVTPASGSGPTPSGSVTFADGPKRLASVSLAKGIASYTVPFAKAGTDEITASYGPSAPYAESSAALSQVVGSGPLPVWVAAFSVNPDPAMANRPARLDAELEDASGSSIDGGTVRFTSGGRTVATVPVTAGNAAATVTFRSSGPLLVRAVYSGTASYTAASGSVEEYVQSSPLRTETVVTSSADPAVSGEAVTLYADVETDALGAAPVGTVTFRSGSTTLATRAVSAGTATLTTRALHAGADPITAFFSGASGYGSSNSASYLQVVGTRAVATTTRLSTAPSPSVSGQNVTLSANVAPTDGVGAVPTGTVTFSSGSTTLGTVALRGGDASIVTSSLPVGTDRITATYQGDQFFAASGTETSETVTSTKDFLPLGFSASCDTAVAGQPITLTADVAAGDATGTVTFSDGSSSLGTTLLVAGGATLSVPSLPAGSDVLTATYSGSSVYAPASSTLTETVSASRLATHDALSASEDPVDAGQLVTLSDEVGSVPGSEAASGTVTFKEGATPLATVPVAGSTATYTTASLPLGNNEITAVYGGDGSLAASSATSDVLVLSDSSSSATGVTVSLGQDPVRAGTSVLVSVAVVALNAGGEPTGMVSLTDGTDSTSSLLGEAALQPGTGTASFQVTLAAAGPNVITANYSGGTGWQASQAATVETVGTSEGATQLAVTSSANPARTGQPITFTAVVSPEAGEAEGELPTGEVTFSAGSTDLGKSDLVGGRASLTTSRLAAAAYVVTASYAGDANYTGSESALGEEVSSAALPTAVLLHPSSSLAVRGQPETLSASVSGEGGVPLHTGTVSFSVGSSALGTADVVAGTAELVTTALPIGTDTVTARYGGDAHEASSTGSAQVRVQSAAFHSAIHFFPTGPVVAGQPATLKVAVSAPVGAAEPSGTVSFTDGSEVLGSAEVSGGTATLSTTDLRAGSDGVTASYGGSGSLDPASATTTISVSGDRFASDTAVWATADDVTTDQQVTLVAQVHAGLTTSLLPSGTVTFTDGSRVLGAARLDGLEASLTTSLPQGTAVISASYGGDGSFKGSTATSSVAVSAGPLPTTTTLASDQDHAHLGEPVTFTATVAGPDGSEPPTGTVIFTSGAKVLGAVMLSPPSSPGGSQSPPAASSAGDSVAALTTSFLAPGNDVVTASYGGRPSYATSSGSCSETVQAGLIAPSVEVTSSNETAASGQPVTLSSTVLPPDGDTIVPSGRVIFSATNGTTRRILGSAPIDELGTTGATITVTSLPLGTDTVTASYSGDGSYAPAAGTLTEDVSSLLIPTVLVRTSPSYVHQGQRTTFVVDVSTHSTTTPTGSVTFTLGSTTLGSVPLQYGAAVFTTGNLAVGTDDVTVTFEPGPYFRTATASTTVVVSASLLATRTAVDGTTPVRQGEEDTIYVVVAGEDEGESAPTGDVTLSSGSSTLGSEMLRNGEAAFVVSSLPVGSDTVTATYGGDANFSASTGSETIVVNTADLTTQSTERSHRKASDASRLSRIPGAPAA